MDIIYNPFQKLGPDDIPRPWLPIVINNPHTGKEVPVYGLIDTGADECAIPAGYAPLLGHDLLKGEQTVIKTGNGETIAYKHTLCLKFDDVVVGNVLIDFMPNLPVVLLGVANFLSHFILTVDYQKSEFSLKKHTK
ncbi:MAG: retropepsin-like aspartic protease [Candidatus Omnitrophota bacterium]